MFDTDDLGDARAVRRVAAGLSRVEGTGLEDPARIELLRALEELKCVAEAVQAEVTAAFDASQREAQAAAGVPAAERGRGIGAQVGLARRESPHRGRQHLGLATVLRRELPLTRAAFRAGRITEWRTMLIARETACLDPVDRRTADRAIAGDPEALEGYSDRVVIAELRKLAAKLDPGSVAARRRRAESQRCVTIRPAPDTMAYLSVLLPVKAAVGAYAALRVAATRATATGDSRSTGQLMADTLVARVTGVMGTDSAGVPVAPVALNLVMSDAALFQGAHEPAHLAGYGPIPADLARELVADHLDTADKLWLRRLYTHPATGELIAMDSRQRLFRGRLRQAIDLRDQFCRTPWCNAPIRHRDHIVDHAQGGETAVSQGQGLCEACNHAKQAPGWNATSRYEPGHVVDTTTPTGHTYSSHAPPQVDLRRGDAIRVNARRMTLDRAG